MKKILMTIVAVICCTQTMTVSAQENRNQVFNITLGNISYAHHDEKPTTGEAIGKIIAGAITGKASIEATKYENDVKNAIALGLSGAHRFIFNSNLSASDPADFIADAMINSIKAEMSSSSYKSGDKTKTTTYKGIVEVMLTLKDAQTGKVLTNSSFKGNGLTSSSYSTQDAAIKQALTELAKRITTWLNNQMPLQANIVEGATAKKEKQKEVYIDLGSSEGAVKGLHMGVFVVKTVAGKEARQQVGKLKIEEVEGDEISLCKVQSGGKDIKAAIDEGKQLVVLSID